MRICLYTATALPKLGGQEAVVDALARHFLRLGHHPVVLAPRPRLPLRPRDGELPYPVARHPRFYSTRHFVTWYRRYLLKLHANQPFDIIHCHDVYPTGYLAALLKDRIHVPLVITSHGGDVKENNIRVSKPGMRPRYVRAVEEADALISIGNFTTEGFRRLWLSAGPIELIPNGIDLEPFAGAAPRPPDLDRAIQPGRYFLFLGRLKRRKGIDVLLEALARLPAGEGVECVIAGSGEEEAALAGEIALLGLGERVRLVGRRDGAEKVYLLQNALAVVMPTRGWEAFPLVLLEAYAAGKPVVGSDVPGVTDLVREGQTGLLVLEEAPDALAAALDVLRRDPSRARRMGENAKQFAQEYSWESIARKHLALYARLKDLPRVHQTGM